MKKRKRIMFSDIARYDQTKGESLIRELKMAVDALVAREPAYCAQFFDDLRLYGLDEARAYVVRFVESKGWRDVEPMVEFSKTVERVRELVG